jgi:Threonine dehydratase
MTAPITFDDVLAARDRIAPFLSPTPLRRHPPLESLIPGVELHVKHENVQPTGSFKVRNGLSTITALDDEQRGRGVVGATTGNHGLGLAYAGTKLGIDVTICVPRGNNPEKNSAMRAWGATVIEDGADYDAAAGVAQSLVESRGLTLAHSTNNVHVLSGAGTMTLEILEQAPELDALIVAIGGGSQAVGAITVARAMRPELRVIGAQAAGRHGDVRQLARPRAAHDRTRGHLRGRRGDAGNVRAHLPALLDGLADFVTVTDAEIAEAVRVILSTTHHLVEGAGAIGVAAVMKLREQLAGQRVGVVFCGGNMDSAVLRRILNREL